MFSDLKKLHHQTLFLYGFFGGYSTGLILSILLSLAINDYISIASTVPSLLFVFLLYKYYKKNEKYSIAVLGLLWNSSFVVFFHIVHNSFTLDIAFLLIIPMAASIMLTKKELILHGSIYYSIIVLLLTYGYFSYTNHVFLHSPQLMASFFVLNFFVFAFGATYHFAITQSYERLEKSNKQKAFLLKEIHHRVKNNLNIVASILGLEKFESDTEEVHMLIAKNKLRIESIAMVHEILYESSDLEQIDFKIYMKKLSEHILATETKSDYITVTLDMVKLHLSIESMMQFGIIINELVTNSIKHAFKEDKGSIEISLIRHDEGYKLTYKDDGIGLQSTKKGFGSSLIEISVQQLDGKLNLINQDGLMYEIIFNA